MQRREKAGVGRRVSGVGGRGRAMRGRLQIDHPRVANVRLVEVDSWIGTTKEYRQQYSYDCLNRLTESVEKYGTSLGSTAYDVKYRYDRYGNRFQYSSDNSGNTAITQAFVESTDYDTTNNNNHFIGTGSKPITYDDDGDIISDGKFRGMLFGYDANERQKYSAQLDGSKSATAIFDGAGQRVADRSAAGMNVMVYDAGGKLAAEYAQTTPPTTAKVGFVTSNYQGSTSVVTDNAGSLVSRHDYLPFGEELGASVGSRTATQGFSQSDNVRQKYAGMETDDATGMNHTL
jgi:hypothetical protein